MGLVPALVAGRRLHDLFVLTIILLQPLIVRHFTLLPTRPTVRGMPNRLAVSGIALLRITLLSIAHLRVALPDRLAVLQITVLQALVMRPDVVMALHVRKRGRIVLELHIRPFAAPVLQVLHISLPRFLARRVMNVSVRLVGRLRIQSVIRHMGTWRQTGRTMNFMPRHRLRRLLPMLMVALVQRSKTPFIFQ
jgi:hypothetical protein